MKMNLKDNFAPLVDQKMVCDFCGKPFTTSDGYCSERDELIVCSWKCIEAWCDKQGQERAKTERTAEFIPLALTMINIKDRNYTCQEPCEHEGCAANRRLVKTPCEICRLPILAGSRFYDHRKRGDKHSVPVHVICVETRHN